MECPACGEPVAPNARFCMECGAPLPLAAPDRPTRAPEGLEGGWRDSCIAYRRGALGRFRRRLAGGGWSLPESPWNECGTLSAIHDATGLEFVLLPEGEFRMGRDDRQPDERPARTVRVPAFLVARTPATEGAWLRPTGGRADHPQRPQVRVSWVSSRAWAEPLGLRLPSEAEWEYAAAGGATGRWWCGDDEECLAGVAWYRETSGGAIHDVALLRPNPFGLFDVHGGVMEWVEDAWFPDYLGAPADATPRRLEVEEEPTALHHRCYRGGSFLLDAEACRTAYRRFNVHHRTFDSLGFRPAADL